MPEGVLPSEPVGSLPPIVSVTLVDVVSAAARPTVLVGGVVSISQEVDSVPVPGLPTGPGCPRR